MVNRVCYPLLSNDLETTCKLYRTDYEVHEACTYEEDHSDAKDLTQFPLVLVELLALCHEMSQKGPANLSPLRKEGRSRCDQLIHRHAVIIGQRFKPTMGRI